METLPAQVCWNRLGNPNPWYQHPMRTQDHDAQGYKTWVRSHNFRLVDSVYGSSRAVFYSCNLRYRTGGVYHLDGQCPYASNHDNCIKEQLFWGRCFDGGSKPKQWRLHIFAQGLPQRGHGRRPFSLWGLQRCRRGDMEGSLQQASSESLCQDSLQVLCSVCILCMQASNI